MQKKEFLMKTRTITGAIVLIFSLIYSASSEMSVTVYSKDEGLHERNLSKPRIFIENTGTVPISDFYYLYYFTAEDGKTPVLDDYYTPNESVSLLCLGHNRYAVQYDFTGVSLYPGQIHPNTSGNVIGIHYQNWEPFWKRNDVSFVFSDQFTQNNNIEVFSAQGQLISDKEPYCYVKSEQKQTSRKKGKTGKIIINADISMSDILFQGEVRKVYSTRNR
jgi:hypothetical protein